MSERAEGRMDWEFDAPVAIGAVPKFIAEVRAAIGSIPVHPDDGSVSEADKAAAYDCISDAMKAFDDAAKAETVNGREALRG